MAYTRGSVVVLVGKLRRDVRCTSVAQFLKTLRVDTLWEREIGMCCCTLVTKLPANCVSQFFVAQVVVLAQRQMGHVCSHMDARVATRACPGGLAFSAECGVGWWRMVPVLLLANCELTSNLLSIRVVSSSSCHSSSSDQAHGKIGQFSELTFEACI